MQKYVEEAQNLFQGNARAEKKQNPTMTCFGIHTTRNVEFYKGLIHVLY